MTMELDNLGREVPARRPAVGRFAARDPYTQGLSLGGVVFLPLVPPVVQQNYIGGGMVPISLLSQNITTGTLLAAALHTTAPVITIEQYSRATGAWTVRVNAAAMTPQAAGGGWVYDYDFPGATWYRGDLAKVTIAGGVVTYSGKTWTHGKVVSTSVVGLAELAQKIEEDVGKVWDDQLAGHAGAGSAGKALADVLASIGSGSGALLSIVEEHLHPHEWFISNEPSVVVAVTTGGADTWGNWAKVTDSAQMPAVGAWFDLHQHLINTPTANKSFMVEIGYGDSGGIVTSIGLFSFKSVSAAGVIPPIFSPGRRVQSSGVSHLYARCKTDVAGGSFYYSGIGHVY